LKERKERKETLKSAKKKAWGVFSEYIRRRNADFGGFCRCVTCGVKKHWKEMQAGHFIGGRGNSILFDEKGVHPQCPKCNIFNHGEQLEYFYWMEKEYGREVIDELRQKKKKPQKMTVYDYQQIRNLYADMLVGLDIRDKLI